MDARSYVIPSIWGMTSLAGAALAVSACSGNGTSGDADSSEIGPGNSTESAFVSGPAASPNPQQTGYTRVSFGYDVTDTSGESGAPTISSDGSYIAFESNASNLVEYDTNALFDIFVFDRINDSISRVIGKSGEGNGNSRNPALTADGRYVVFESRASNLVDRDLNNVGDIFLFDRESGILERASIGQSGESSHGSESPDISDDGTLIVFQSKSDNLVPGDLNQASDIFLRDRNSGTTRLLSSPAQGKTAALSMPSASPSISGDGSAVVFVSYSTALVNQPTNGIANIYIRDIQSQQTELVSRGVQGVSSNGESRSAVISNNAGFVVFSSSADNLVEGSSRDFMDIYLYDTKTMELELISKAANGGPSNGDSVEPDISPTGTHVVYRSSASNLVNDDNNDRSDVFIYDMGTKQTYMVGTVFGDGDSYSPALSDYNHEVVFSTQARNLLPGDGNQSSDIYLFSIGL